jgi:glycerol-3-phosphate dehydrogenase
VTCTKDLGQDFGSGLYQREVEYLIEHEWATTAEDILFRRTKIGLVMSTKNAAELEKFLRLNHAKLVKSKNKSK